MKKINLSTRINNMKKAIKVTNLKKNWYFPISAMAFFCLTLDNSLGYCIGMLITFGLMIVISGQVASIWDEVNNQSFCVKIFCVAGSFGICLGNQMHFYVQTLKLMLPDKFNNIFLIISYVGAFVAIWFVYVCLVFFWNTLLRVFEENQTFEHITRAERIIYVALVIIQLLFMIFAFSKSDAFYGTELSYNIIYTSDSPALVKDNVYLALTHSENDLRQPLFAVFAAPFISIPYLLGRLFGVSASVQAMLLNGAQVIMLVVANYILAKMMKLTPIKRICLMLLTFCTYMQLLFTLMMEQYIVAYFWLIFCMYLISEGKHVNRIAFWGAGGTLLISVILLPFMSEKSPLKNFKDWLIDMVKYGMEFVAILLVFCRFDVIFNLVAQISFLSGYTGKSVSFADKVYQYTEFICNCFVAPDAGVKIAAGENVSWQLNAVMHINFVGVAILALVIISAVLNRDKKSSLLAFSWVAFSAVILWGLGWGTKENGLILYALYFGWAFLVLLFQMVDKIEDKLNVKFLVPVVSVGCSVILSAINIPAIMEMVDFAITYFPV